MTEVGTEAGWVVEPLDKTRHNRATFACGYPALDDYLRKRARQDADRRLAAVFVAREPDASRVIGYYSLSSLSVVTRDLPAEFTRQLARYPELPAALLGRLAVDQAYAGVGLGRFLLIDALRRAHEHSSQVAHVAVIADAKDEQAAGFYERYGFNRFPDRPLRFYLPITAVAKLFA